MLRVGTKNERFYQRSKRGDLGEIKFFGFRRCSRDLLLFYYVSRGRNFSYFGFIPTFGLILGLIVGWFYAMFMACFIPCLWCVLWPQFGGYCGRWKMIVPGWFRVKMACTRAAKELFGMLLCCWARNCVALALL